MAFTYCLVGESRVRIVSAFVPDCNVNESLINVPTIFTSLISANEWEYFTLLFRFLNITSMMVFRTDQWKGALIFVIKMNETENWTYFTELKLQWRLDKCTEIFNSDFAEKKKQKCKIDSLPTIYITSNTTKNWSLCTESGHQWWKFQRFSHLTQDWPKHFFNRIFSIKLIQNQRKWWKHN